MPGYWENQLEMTNIRVDGNNGRSAGMVNEGFGNSGGFIAINYGRTLVV